MVFKTISFKARNSKITLKICGLIVCCCAVYTASSTLITPSPVRGSFINFSVPGLHIPVELALDIDLPPLPEENSFPVALPREVLQDAPRLLVAVTTACCQHLSMARRKAIRATWITMTRKTTPDVDVLFFLAQAQNASVLKEWAPLLEVN
jgi:hypothetical protein